MSGEKTKKKISSGVIVLIIVLIAVVLLSVAQIVSAFAEGSPRANRSKNIPHSNGKYVAELYIDGTITDKNETYNQEWLFSTIEQLKNDPKNEGILLYIDSPGGAVYQADEAYLALMDYRAEKPVWAYFGSLAASGGYYIGCSAEKIAANRNTLTGSIGVIAGRSVDLTGLMNKYGIKMTTITAGKNKNMMGIDSPVTEEQKKIMQDLADECYEQFVGIVADSRNLSIAQTKQLADGRIYTAKQAKENGLIDEICSLEEFETKFKEFLRNDKITFQELKYEREKKFYEDFFSSFSKINNRNSEFEMIQEMISTDMTYPAFLYQAN